MKYFLFIKVSSSASIIKIITSSQKVFRIKDLNGKHMIRHLKVVRGSDYPGGESMFRLPRNDALPKALNSAVTYATMPADFN